MLGFLNVTGAGNLCMAAGDSFLYYRSGQYLAVKLDSDFFAYIAGSKVSKFFAALIIKFQTYYSLIPFGKPVP